MTNGPASTNLEDFFDGTGYAGGTIKLACDASLTAASVDAILDEAMSGHTTAGSLAKLISDINTIVTAVKAKTDPWPSIVYP